MATSRWAAYGRKGGLARRRQLTREERSGSARQAALARHAQTPKKERVEAARRAAEARWAKRRA